MQFKTDKLLNNSLQLSLTIEYYFVHLIDHAKNTFTSMRERNILKDALLYLFQIQKQLEELFKAKIHTFDKVMYWSLVLCYSYGNWNFKKVMKQKKQIHATKSLDLHKIRMYYDC